MSIIESKKKGCLCSRLKSHLKQCLFKSKSSQQKPFQNLVQCPEGKKLTFNKLLLNEKLQKKSTALNQKYLSPQIKPNVLFITVSYCDLIKHMHKYASTHVDMLSCQHTESKWHTQTNAKNRKKALGNFTCDVHSISACGNQVKRKGKHESNRTKS